MSGIKKVIIALAITCGLMAAISTPAMAASTSVAKTAATASQRGGFCNDSKPYSDSWRIGVHISHCDLQQLTLQSNTGFFISNMIQAQGVGLIMAAIEAHLLYMKSIDRGNGVIVVIASWNIIPNPTTIWAA